MFYSLFQPILEQLDIHEGAQLTGIFQLLNKLFCTRGGIFKVICATLLFVTGGNDPAQLNTVGLNSICKNRLELLI